jgi:hypothetical protein
LRGRRRRARRRFLVGCLARAEACMLLLLLLNVLLLNVLLLPLLL